MFVWEMIAHRLRAQGWKVWHRRERLEDASEPQFTVELQRPGFTWATTAATLTDAYGEAARQAREQSSGAVVHDRGPHFSRISLLSGSR